MSDWTVHLELEDGNSSKFWRARVEGKTLHVNYGKIGSNGQTQVKDLADPAAAKREYDKLVAEKRKKGYADAGSGGGRSPAGDDEDADTGSADDADHDDGEDDERPARKPAGKRAPAAPASKPAAPPAPRAAPAAAPRSAPGHRLVLDAGGRQVETTLYLDGNTLRMDSQETYPNPEAASRAFERLKKLLAGEGYQAG